MKLLVTDYDNTLELHYDFTDNNSILTRNIITTNQFVDNNISFNYLCANNGAELYNKNYKLLFCIPICNHDLKVLSELGKEVLFRNPCNCQLITSANLYI